MCSIKIFKLWNGPKELSPCSQKFFLLIFSSGFHCYLATSQQAQGPKTPRPIRIEQCFPTGVVRTWYGVCTECGYGVGTERVQSGYGARGFSRGRGVKIALEGPRNLFRGVISLTENFDFFSPPSSVPTPYFYPVT